MFFVNEKPETAEGCIQISLCHESRQRIGKALTLGRCGKARSSLGPRPRPSRDRIIVVLVVTKPLAPAPNHVVESRSGFPPLSDPGEAHRSNHQSFDGLESLPKAKK